MSSLTKAECFPARRGAADPQKTATDSTYEKFAPDSTALAFFNPSTSFVLASFRDA
jgi:hypothetical protein